MPQEQYAHRSTMQTSEGPQDGMGNLRITEKGLKLEGDSEFLKPLYAKEIRSRPGNPLYFQSARNVTVNILNEKTKVLTRLVTGPQAVEAHSQKFEVKTLSGKLLFSADDNEVVVGAERLRVLGAEGTVFPKSIETPNVRADPFKELRLESPTRALVMEAPKGIEINAEAGSLKATCRTELRLESKDGELLCNIWEARVLPCMGLSAGDQQPTDDPHRVHIPPKPACSSGTKEKNIRRRNLCESLRFTFCPATECFR
ncbi:delta-sarcoglycan isoform X3 [Caloenas nicobarica]|uniref:delta-sarcoglycan isoform X3 n=1 Tax=Caloenas nicobarica TaxID=187106 RepID=UPI0032B83042